MISGTVVADREAIVPMVLHDAGNQEHALMAVVDTGFTGSVTLSREIITRLALPWYGQSVGILADGSSVACNVYEATVIWDGQPQVVLVHEMEADPSIGMRLLHGFRLVMETIDGGSVRLERM